MFAIWNVKNVQTLKYETFESRSQFCKTMLKPIWQPYDLRMWFELCCVVNQRQAKQRPTRPQLSDHHRTAQPAMRWNSATGDTPQYWNVSSQNSSDPCRVNIVGRCVSLLVGFSHIVAENYAVVEKCVRFGFVRKPEKHPTGLSGVCVRCVSACVCVSV